MKNALQGTYGGGGSDAFIFELNPAGTQLVFSTFLGGAAVDYAQGLALDSSDNIYVVGFTDSTNFPVKNAFQATSGGGQDAWVAKIASSGTTLDYSTYLGGAQDDSAQAVGIGSSGDVYVAGDTYSANFPVKSSLQAYGGGDDAFVTELNPSGSALVFSTYLGGSGDDRASALHLDGSGDIYIVGSTTSANFPTVNAFQPTYGGNTDAFVTKLTPSGSSIGFSSYLGGSGLDQAQALTIDSSNNLYIVGFTASTDFPTLDPTQPTLGGGDGDAFLAKMSGNGSTLLFSTYFGGSDDDRATGVAVDAQNNIYVVGSTASNNLPTLNALQPSFGGSNDAFLIKVSQAPATQLGISAPVTTAGNTFSITVTGLDSQGNPAGEYTGTIHFTSTDPFAVLPANYTFKGADNGSHTFTGVQLKTVGLQSITAVDIANNTIVGTHTGIVVTPMVSSFTFTGMPSTTTAGVFNSITVTARDALGNVATGYTGTIHFTTSDPIGVLPADYQFTPADHGVHTFANVVLKTAGTQSITVTDTTLTIVHGTQSGITVNAASGSLATHFNITMPTQLNSGSAVSVTITALDATNALAADYRGTVHFVASDGSATLPADYTFTAADQGSHTFPVTFVTEAPQTLTVTDTVKASITATVSNIRVNPQVSQLFLTSRTSSAQAGTPLTITITAEDVLNGLATGYQGTIHFTSNDKLAGLPADYTFTAADQGVHSFQVTFNTGGGIYLIATDTTKSSLIGSANFFVTSIPKAIVVSGLGQPVGAGVAQSVTVTVVDANGNPVPNYLGTVHFTSSDGQALLPANYTFVPADLGKHTFQITFKTIGPETLSVADIVNNSLNATASFSVIVMAQNLVLSGLPPTSALGATQNVTVTLLDNLGNVATGYVGTVHFASSDGGAMLPADYTFTAADQGKHTFPVTFESAGAQSVTVDDTANTALKASANVSVTVVAQVLVLSGLGQTANPGVPANVTVTLTDNQGHVATGYVGTVQFASSDGQAILPASYTFTSADLGKHTFQVTFKTVGSQSVSVTDTTNNALTASANVSVIVPAQLVVFTGLGQNVPAGTPQNVTVTLTDNFGNVATGYVGIVHFTSSDGQAVLPADYTFTAADQGTHAFQVTFKTTGTQSLTATDTVNSALKATANVTVTTTAQILALTGLGPTVIAGPSQTITVTMMDNFGNVATGYVGTVHFTSSDGQATLPADYTFTAADKGKHNFQVSFKTTGAQSLSATDTTNAALSATADFTVNIVTQTLLLSGLGQTASAGAAQAVTVTLLDSLGNVATNYVGTVHFTSSDGHAVLPANYTFTAADEGTHTFPVTFDTTGTQSLSATDTVNSALKATANVSVTTTAQILALTGIGQTVIAGPSQTITVTMMDNFGNVATGYVGTVHFTSSDGQATLPADYTFTAADKGKHSFQVAFKTTGAQSLSATDTTNAALSATANFTVNVVTQTLLLSGLGQSASAGAAQTVTVTLLNSLGNVATNYVGTVHFASSDGQAVLPANYTFTAADQGTHAFQVTFETTGSQSLSAIDTANSALTASGTTSVTTTAQLLVLSGLGQTGIAGTPQNVTVTLTDNFGNVATGYVGTVHFTSSDGKAILPADYTFTAADHGSHTFSVEFETSGAQSITAKDVANASLNASASLQVVAVATHLEITSAATTVAGNDIAVTVTAEDAFGNIASGYVGTVSMTSTDSKATLVSNYTFTSANQGSITFASVKLDTAGGQTISIRDINNTGLGTGVDSVTVDPGAVASMTFTTEPLTSASGVVQAPALQVSLFDAFGNLATNSTGQVSLALAGAPTGISLTGTTNVTPANGIATFSNVTVTGFGLGLMLQANTGTVTQNSTAFNSIELSSILPVVVAPVIYGPTPNASVIEAYIKGVYRTLLGRNADPSGLTFWESQLNSGASRTAIIESFWNSPENRGREVDAYYEAYLGRKADPQGRAFWIEQLQDGVDETAIVDSFLLSAEELQATNEVFVERLYQGALGRGASAGEINYWLGQLSSGETRQQITNSFVFSPEAAGVAIDSYYGAYLQRKSDPGGRAFWVNEISSQEATYASVAKSLLASDEFFANAAKAVPGG